MKSTRKNKHIRQLLGLAAVVVIITGLFVPPSDGESGFWFSHVPAFFALLGFAGCAAIVVLAKWLGRYLLQRKEDYYD